MDALILALLGQDGSLAYEHIAAHLNEPPDAVRNVLTSLRARGLVEVLGIDEVEGHSTRAPAYWRLTDAGRNELARLYST